MHLPYFLFLPIGTILQSSYSSFQIYNLQLQFISLVSASCLFLLRKFFLFFIRFGYKYHSFSNTWKLIFNLRLNRRLENLYSGVCCIIISFLLFTKINNISILIHYACGIRKTTNLLYCHQNI